MRYRGPAIAGAWLVGILLLSLVVGAVYIEHQIQDILG